MNDFRLWTARYPNVDPQLAYMYFMSDRRGAGLGALDESRRKRGAAISNSKRRLSDSDIVMYRMRLYRPRRAMIPADVPALCVGYGISEAHMTVKIIDEVNLACDFPVSSWKLNDRSGRTLIARELRRIRREMRK